MAHRHPLGDDAVARAAAAHDCPTETLHDVLDRYDETTAPRLENVVENADTELRADRRVLEHDAERLTLHVDTATFRYPFMQLEWRAYTDSLREAGRDHETARSILEDAVVEAHQNDAADAGVAPDADGLLALTSWRPRIYELEAGGMSRQEARAHVLRDSGCTQTEVRDRMGLPSTSAAKNTLHRGDEKVRAARRLLDAADV